jgi:small subunit ribosomal protein S17
MENQKKQRMQKVNVGEVVSHKMDKTAIVSVENVSHHPMYHKTVRKVIKFKAHDENNEAGVGDIVRVILVRPLSKEKRWKIVEIIKKGVVAEVKPQEI